MGAFVFPTILHGQIDTLLAMPESNISANPNAASPRLKSDYFLAESKFQEEAFHESQQLFQKLIDTFQKATPSTRNELNLPTINNDAQFISGAYFRLSQLSAKDYSIYSQGNTSAPINSGNAAFNGQSSTSKTNDVTMSTMHKANIQMALYQLDLALKYSPNNKDYLYAKAQLLEKTQNWMGAAKIYKDLCSIDPHSWTFHEKAATAYFEYLPQVLNGKGEFFFRDEIENAGKSKHKNPSNVAQSQLEILQEFQSFSDTWEKHFSLSPSIVETKLYILWCQEVFLKFPAEIIDNQDKNASILQKYQSMIPVDISNWMLQNDFTNNTYQLKKINDVQRSDKSPKQGANDDAQNPNIERKMNDSEQNINGIKATVQQQLQSGVVRHADKIFYVAIIRQDWLMAYQYADTLENTLPIFTARDLVKGFQQLAINQPKTAVEICKNSAIETNPFMIQLYLLLEAKATTQIAKSHTTDGGQIASGYSAEMLAELSHSLALWQKLYDQKALTELNDISEAKSIALTLNNQDWLDRFQQLASDLNTTPSNPNQK
jgi:hypothetical protein